MMAVERSKIRVVVQQPALPRYRVPVFREFARREGIDLTVKYGEMPGLQNHPPEGFHGSFVPSRRLRLAGYTAYWHSPQLRYAARRNADVLVLTWNVHFASLLPALVRARSNGVPTVLWGHGISKAETRLRALPRKTVAQMASALLFYSRSIADHYIRSGWDARRIFVAPNSLDQWPIQQAQEQWLNDPQRLQRFREDHGLSAQQVLLFVSRLVPQRRLDLLFQAVKLLEQRYPLLKVVVVGSGPHDAQLRREAQQLAISDRVQFVGAIYDEHALAPWFLSATAFVYPVHIGLSILHAFGYGLPVITSDRLASHGPEIEALRHGENGLLYEHDNVQSLAQTIARLLDDQSMRARMSQEAQRTVAERYSLSRMVDGLEAAVQFAAAARTRKAGAS